MKFSKGQIQILDLIQKGKGFLHLFPLMRVVIQDEPASKQYDIARDSLQPDIDLTQNFINNFRAFYKALSPQQLRDFKQSPSLRQYFQSEPQAKLLKELKPKILEYLDYAELDFQWNEISEVTEQDLQNEFWKDAVGYYTQSVCFEEFSPAKAKASLANQIKMGRLDALRNPNSSHGMNWFGKILIVLRATREQELREQKHRYDPNKLEEKITALVNEIDSPDTELKKREPQSTTTYAVPLVTVLVVVCAISFAKDTRFGIAASFIMAILGAVIWKKIIIPHLDAQQANYTAFLQQEFDQTEKEFKDNTQLQRIKIIKVEEEKREVEIQHLCVFPTQLQNFVIEAAAELDTSQPAKQLKRKNMSSAVETKDMPKPSAKQMNQTPEEIEFKLDDGRVIKFNPKTLSDDDPVKPIHDGTGNLWGILDEEKLGFAEKDPELKFFRNTLKNGTYVPSNLQHKQGIKEQEPNTWIYNKTTKKWFLSHTYLRPAGTGARIASQRYVDKDGHRLELFGNYFPPKLAHR